MPYNYHFSRTYTFVYPWLTPDERRKCREVMRIRGREMFAHLCPRHLWRPYSSHSNRAWHFLGEVGLAFLNEIPEAGDWVWFAANVFATVYPVWSDADGGWHEGNAYWNSYIQRFTWWADVMRAALGINAYDKPYFSRIGYYPLYLMPPGTRGGGFGDLTARRTSSNNCALMTVLAAQSGNPYWQWYVEAHGGPVRQGGIVGFVRGALPPVGARPLVDLPTSRCFRGTGQAVLNSSLLRAPDNVEVIFKSSPFGTQSHGYESQNAFLLYAFGERLFIRTGRRDSYGSKHHRDWMWQTKSVNSITVNGKGQIPHSGTAKGRIVAFTTSPALDYVAGEAAEAYAGNLLQTFRRRILFLKPHAVVIFDELAAPEPSSFEWWLHAPVPFAVEGQGDVRIQNDGAACRASFLWPPNLQLRTTDAFDPPPRARIKLTEYHLTAATSQPARRRFFVTVLQPHRSSVPAPQRARIEQVDGGFGLQVPLGKGGNARILLGKDDGGVRGLTMATQGRLAVTGRTAAGNPIRFTAGD